jgi:nucleoside 2-deoxyribosyltransferase
MNCPICKLAAENVKETPVGDRHDIECARCGRYKISGSAVAICSSRTPDYGLSAWIRSQNEAASPPGVSSTTLDDVHKGLPQYRVSEKQLIFLRALEHRTSYPGRKVHIVPEFDFPLAWCSAIDELEYIIRALMARALVELDQLNDPNESFSLELTITPAGWTFLDEANRASVLTNQVFVAMSFAEEMKLAWKLGIEPAIRSAMFQPYRVDVEPHLDRIDNKIITEIKNSRFVVADVTMQRPGVYFEAGFAIGLGIPVFWCVREDDLNNVHFDTRQYNHIVWKNEQELAQKLQIFISAIIGRGTAS